jgi:glycosyltransferase involved in cell wall biosynthesis
MFASSSNISVAAAAELPLASESKTGWPWTFAQNKGWSTTDKASWPRISIVTPSFNQAEYIEEAIRSVLAQGYPNLEYVLMDGGSTDGTLHILRKYETHFAYFHSGPDGGQAAALAEGFRHCTGDILAWLNSDDRFLPGTFGRVADYFRHHRKVMFVNSDVNFVDGEGELLYRMYVARPVPLFSRAFASQGAPQMGCFWRRQAYEKAGGVDPSFNFCMDLDLFIRLWRTGRSRRLPGPPTADSRMHDQAKTARWQAVADKENALIIARHSSWLLTLARPLLKLYRRLWFKQTALRRMLVNNFALEA